MVFRRLSGRRYRLVQVMVFFFAFFMVIGLLSPMIFQYVIFRLPPATADFDCDDGTALMIERLGQIGIKSTAILGNLRKTGESYLETNHVWVLANIAGFNIAFDWGTQRFDKQHYEGFSLTESQLIYFVEQDRTKNRQAQETLPADYP